MAKAEQVLRIEPANELRFRGPFTTQVTSYMKLFNPTSKKIFFKIKTTAPKKYCVRPNCGVLEPKGQAEVAVSLQPFDYDPAEKNKHKFMVLATIAPDGDSYTSESIWQNLKPEDTMDSKLKCVFEFPSENETGSEVPATGEESKKLEVESKVITKPQAEPAPDHVKDIKNLRMEESFLRQENIELKEEVLRLRRALTVESAVHSVTPAALKDPPARAMSDFIVAIVIALVCLVIGKIAL